MKDMNILKFKNGNLEVVCDRDKVIPNDPGADTPCMVYYKTKSKQACATYWCATGTGWLQSQDEQLELTQSQLEWLDSLDEKITDFLYR